MASEESKKIRIMEFSFQKFSTMGIPQITMDEIARGVGMGKGTLYKLFPSKEALLFETIDYTTTCVEQKIEEIMADTMLTTAQKLTQILKVVADKLTKINSNCLAYLERSQPEAFERINEARRRIVMHNFLKLFREGKQSGLFLPDMDECLVTHIIVGAANHIIDNRILSTLDYGLNNLFATITSVIFKGCLTEEGRKQVV